MTLVMIGTVSQSDFSNIRDCICVDTFDSQHGVDARLPPPERVRALVWVCCAAAVEPEVVSFDALLESPSFQLERPPHCCDEYAAKEANALRRAIDSAWRARAKRALSAHASARDSERARAVIALDEDMMLRSAAHYLEHLPSWARRDAPRPLDVRKARRLLSMKEAIDWVAYLRVTTGARIGVTLEQRVLELGLSLRTFRRICRRLRRWIPEAPGHVHPRMVIDALCRRLAPPPRGSMTSDSQIS